MYTKQITREFGNQTVLDIKKITIHAVSALVILVVLFGSFGTISAGERGVKTRFSAVVGTVGEGLYVKLPFIEHVVRIDIKTQKEQVEASAASKDLQTVNSAIALNYSLDPSLVAHLYQSVGIGYKERIIDPVIQESVKASTAKFTAEELITKREEVRAEIETHLREKFQGSGVVVVGLNITNFDFSKSFNDAIEAKVTAEQNALAAKNKLSQVQYEAQQAIEKAKGNAEALRVESAAINSNPQVLQLRAIEKWNGVLPQVTSGATPFINLK